MNSSIIAASLLLLAVHAGAQEKMDSVELNYFNIALEQYELGNLEAAIDMWKFIVENELGRDSEIYGYSFQNVAVVYSQLENFEQAEKWYKKILASDLEDSFWIGGLMDPHANYKHHAATSLAMLALRDSNYTEALYWLDQAETVYRYWGFPGSATNTSKRQASMLDIKTELLIKIGRETDAIRLIITELICSNYLHYFFSPAENKLFTLIDTLSFRANFDQALESMIITQIDEHTWEATFELIGQQYQIPIKNEDPSPGIPQHHTIYLISFGSQPDKNAIINDIQSMNFYQRLP